MYDVIKNVILKVKLWQFEHTVINLEITMEGTNLNKEYFKMDDKGNNIN